MTSVDTIVKCAGGGMPLAHFFNPGYEASVALGDRAFTPSASVARMRWDLWELPYYFASGSDVVLDPSDLPRALVGRYMLAPWGWAPELRYGCLSDAVPYTVEEMRGWASRRNTVLLVEEMVRLRPQNYSSGLIPRTSDTVCDGTGQYVIKEEFSSSGRGVAFVNGADLTKEIEKRCGRTGEKLLFVEHRYDKVSDRGYEFVRDDRRTITYAGPSDFTVTDGRYQGNRIAPAEEIHQKWRAEGTRTGHDEYVERLLTALSALPLGRYRGVIGVDTITYRTPSGQLDIHPCIEVNIRPTMGWLALALSERYPLGGRAAHFGILYLPSAGMTSSSLLDTCVSPRALYRMHREGETLSPGRYLLTTLRPDSKFAALLTVG